MNIFQALQAKREDFWAGLEHTVCLLGSPGLKPRQCVGINFHMEPDVPERKELLELGLADLQSRPCPGGRAVGWWSSLHGPIRVETQSRPGRSPSLATSPSISAESTEQQLSTCLLDFFASLCPFFLFCSVLYGLWFTPFVLWFIVSRTEREQVGVKRPEFQTWLCPDLTVWSWASQPDSLGSVWPVVKWK